MSSDIPRVVVFGSVGQGKSSLINLLARKEVVAAGNSATGVTFASTEVEVISPNNKRYTFVDTAGLNEADDVGTIADRAAFGQLMKLLKDGSTRGFALALFVDRGRMTHKCFKGNYDIFVESLFASRDCGIPVVLVQLGMETVQDWRTDWYEAKDIYGKTAKEIREEKYPLFTSVVGGTAVATNDPDLIPIYNKKRLRTVDELWAMIEQYPDNKHIPWAKVNSLAVRVWNNTMKYIGELLGNAKKYIDYFLPDGMAEWTKGIMQDVCNIAGKAIKVPKKLVQMFMRMGLSEEEAKRWAADFVNEE